jgi:hypothetical protein
MVRNPVAAEGKGCKLGPLAQLVDNLYFIDKTQRHKWKSLALAPIANFMAMDDKLSGSSAWKW